MKTKTVLFFLPLVFSLISCGALSGHDATHVLAEYTSVYRVPNSVEEVRICYDKVKGQASIIIDKSVGGGPVERKSSEVELSLENKNVMEKKINSVTFSKETTTYGSLGEAEASDNMPMILTFFSGKAKNVVNIDVANTSSLPEEILYLYQTFAHKSF